MGLSKKVLLDSCDYEKYFIPLPLKIAFSKNREKYLFTELEKVHPGFSTRNCINSKWFFRGKKLFTNLTVVDCLRLAEYKKKFPHKNLFVLNGKKTERVFISKIRKVLNFLTVVIAIILFFNGINKLEKHLSKKSFSKKIEQDFKENSSICTENELQKLTHNKDIKNIEEEFLKSFYEVIKNNNGCIERFEYNYLADFIEIRANLENCLPEKILFSLKGFPKNTVSISSIKYNKNKPSFSVIARVNRKNVSKINTGEQPLRQTDVVLKVVDENLKEDSIVKKTANNNLFEENDFDLDSFIFDFRSILKDTNSQILTESFMPYSSDFLCYTSSLQNILLRLAKTLNKFKIGIRSLVIEKSESGESNIRLVFEKNSTHLEFLIPYISILKKTSINSKNQIAVKKEASLQQPILQKDILGEVISSTGKKYFFLKKTNGEIYLHGETEK